ncbi:calcium-binding protein [Rhizobium sp.]
MAFTYHQLDTQAYGEVRMDLMTDIWGRNFKPYVDPYGIARIGPNISMVDYMEDLVLAVMSPANYDAVLVDLLRGAANQVFQPGQTNKLIKNLNEVMADWAADHGLPNKYKVFELKNLDQILTMLPNVLSEAENALDNLLPDSDERAVLVSLYQEGQDVFGLIDEIVTNENRVNAWFEIRYGSNGREGVDPSQAIASRRFLQSDQFSLYDPGAVDYPEARDVGFLYTKYRLNMLQYESKWNVPDGAKDIVATLQPAIRAVAEYYNVTLPGRLEELLFVDRGTSSSDPWLGDGKTKFDTKANDADFLLGASSVADFINGGRGNDLILGLEGDDRLDGGDGNDILYGGTGADILKGGKGNDTLWGGGGIDRLVGGKGNDTYVLGDDLSNEEGGPGSGGGSSLIGGMNDDVISEAKNGGTDTLIARVGEGDFNIRHVEKFKLAGDIAGSISVKLNEFRAFTLSNGDDDLTLVINRLQKAPIEIKTNGGADTIRIEFEKGIDPSQVLDGKGLTARFKFSDLSANDTIDLTSIGIKDIIMKRDQVDVDKGFYLLAPGAKLDLMDGKQIDKTYNNYTDNWFVVKLGDSTPFGPEFIGHNIDKSHFDI